MPRDKLLFKYTGDGAEFHPGIPKRDLHESDRDSLSDMDLVTLAQSPLYEARNDAPGEVAQAEKRVEREAAEAATVEAVSVTVAGAEKPAKVETKR